MKKQGTKAGSARLRPPTPLGLHTFFDVYNFCINELGIELCPDVSSDSGVDKTFTAPVSTKNLDPTNQLILVGKVC